MADTLRIWPSPARPASRFEFRCWGDSLAAPRRIFESRWHRQGDAAGVDVYYLGGDPDISLKSRAGRFQVKECIGRQGLLQEWQKAADIPFPLALDEVLPWLERAFAIPSPAWGEGTIDQETLEAFLRRQAGVTVAAAEKRRAIYRLSVLTGEYARVTVTGRTVETVAVESEDAAAVESAIRDLGIADLPNEAYSEALKRYIAPSADPA